MRPFSRALIIDNFVPVEVRQRTLERAFFDDDDDEWRLAAVGRTTNGQAASVMGRPVSVVGARRPQSDFGRISAATAPPNSAASFRFRGENILLLELDLPERNTRDYQGTNMC